MAEAANEKKPAQKSDASKSKGKSSSTTKPKDESEELSDEDLQLKSDLDMLVERLLGANEKLYGPALASMKTLIRESTSSMTAVPKPLKFLRPHYDALCQLAGKWSDNDLRIQLCDILSILAMTYSAKDGTQYANNSIKWRLQSNVDASIGEWGHEYLRHLSLEIGDVYRQIVEGEESKDPKSEKDAKADEKDDSIKDKSPVFTLDDLLPLTMIIVQYFLKHNAETEAVDLLLEIEQIEKLPQYVDKDTYKRVCNYMEACVPLLAPPDDLAFVNTAYAIYLSNNQLPQALRLAIKLDDESLIKAVFDATADDAVHKQLGLILGQQNSCFKVSDTSVQECISNCHMSRFYQYLVSELNLLQPKVPEDVYKSHLETSFFPATSRLESAKQNLAAALVNGFLNAGYCKEKLIVDEKWSFRTRGEGITSTIASLGLVNLWNTNDGLQVLDKYLYSEQTEVKAGALLGMGVLSSGVHDEVEPALLILQDYISTDSAQDARLTTAAITGIGIAFAGSRNKQVLELLTPLITEPTSMEIQSLAALALGHVFVGTCNGEITSTIMQALLETEPSDLTSKWVRFMCLGLGLLYMGKYDQTDVVFETIDAIDHPIVKTLKVLVTICAYAGTGNVLQIQQLLQMCIVKDRAELDEDDIDEELEDDEEKKDAEEEEKKDEDEEGANDEESHDRETHEEETHEQETHEEEPEDNGEMDTGADHEEAHDTDTSSKAESKETKEDNSFQGYCVLGLALIAMGEEIGQQMSLRHFDHLMHYGSPLIRRTVPLAMGLVSVSDPEMSVYDTLSRYSHDQDLDVAYNAIFAMGLIGAGTNNARLDQLLRQLASYYINNQNGLFVTRLAQGLVHLGKGSMMLSPFTIDRQTMSKVSLASLLTIGVALLDPTMFLMKNDSSLIYYMTPAIKPRMLVTVDTDLKPIKVNVRVGQAVDVVGQAGRPKTITGWVTHSTPVLLGYGERAELENDEYIPLSSYLEGVVILKKNEEYMEIDG